MDFQKKNEFELLRSEIWNIMAQFIIIAEGRK
jgi:hypothetical protein